MRELTTDEKKSLHRALRDTVKIVHKATPEQDARKIVQRIFRSMAKNK